MVFIYHFLKAIILSTQVHLVDMADQSRHVQAPAFLKQ